MWHKEEPTSVQLLDLDGRLGYHRSPRSEVDIHDSRDSEVEGYES